MIHCTNSKINKDINCRNEGENGTGNEISFLSLKVQLLVTWDQL